MLKREKKKAKNKSKKKKIENEIYKTEELLVRTRRNIKSEKERNAIDAMKKNPKIFYSIYNRRKNRKNELGPLKENDKLIYNGEEISEIFRRQYRSQFSENTNDKNTSPFDMEDPDDLNDISIAEEDIMDAINKLDENSGAGPDGIPAIFLIKTKEIITAPLTLMLRKSLDEGKIPDIFKMAYISPIHKGGSKQKPEQYRPVSLTSHIAKVFERVIKKKIVEHLVKIQRLNDDQHGFAPGRST